MENKYDSYSREVQAKRTENLLGFYASIFISVLTLATFAIAVLTPPLSGPYCQGTCFQYPFLDIASRFPRDYLWMYPAIVMNIIFLVFMVCIHHYAPNHKKIFSQIGLIFAAISAALLISDYFVQVSVIQPSLLNGEKDGISMLSQYNPHGLFIALEDIGYLLMSLAFFCTAPIFVQPGKVEKAVRWLFIGGFVAVIAGLVIISTQYGIYREYRFEVLSLSINWIVLIVSGILMSIIFKRALKS